MTQTAARGQAGYELHRSEVNKYVRTASGRKIAYD